MASAETLPSTNRLSRDGNATDSTGSTVQEYEVRLGNEHNMNHSGLELIEANNAEAHQNVESSTSDSSEQVSFHKNRM